MTTPPLTQAQARLEELEALLRITPMTSPRYEVLCAEIDELSLVVARGEAGQ